MEKINKIAVIGAGSWGTALAILLSSKGYPVNIWGHNKSHIETLIKEKENSRYLPGQSFPDTLIPETNIDFCLRGAETVVMAVPSHSLRLVFSEVLPCLEKGSTVISVIKGIEEKTFYTMTEVIHSVMTNSSLKNTIDVGVLSGPSFALEVSQKLPTAVTVGFSSVKTAKKQQNLFGTPFFRVYTSSDIRGIEISGALKNVIAIATGMSDGLGFGLNARAALITRGLAEIKRLGVVMGADPTTFSGLSGVGDLFLTCTGGLSRNRQVGLQLGKGKNIETVQQQIAMVAEGIKTAKSGYFLAKNKKIEMPILEQVYKILYENKSCSDAVQKLLNRDFRQE